MAADQTLKIAPVAKLLPSDACNLIASAVRHARGLCVFSGHFGSGKTTVAMSVANEAGLGGRPIVLVTESDEEPSFLLGAEVPVMWTTVVAGPTEAHWEAALGRIVLSGNPLVVVPELTPSNVRAAFDVSQRVAVIACVESPLVGIDVVYTLTQLGMDREKVISALSLINSQFLIRKLCDECRVPVSLSGKDLRDIAPGRRATMDVWVEGGCEACSGTGTRGRTAVCETIVVDASTRDSIADAARAYRAPDLPATHYRSMQDFARALLLEGVVGVGTFRDEIGRNPMLRATNELERERDSARTTRQLFGRFVDDSVIESFIADDDALHRAKRADATCLFCDVRGFTAFAEHSEPHEVFRTLNRIFDQIIPIVVRHGGMVDKLVGDAVMALFGLPIAQADHAARAAACALAIQDAMKRFARDHPEVSRLQVGIGINSGELAAGCLGNGQRLDYSVLGDVVNVASRLEGMAAPGQVLVGRSTRHRLGKAFATRDLGDRALKGKSEVVRVYELVPAQA